VTQGRERDSSRGKKRALPKKKKKKKALTQENANKRQEKFPSFERGGFGKGRGINISCSENRSRSPFLERAIAGVGEHHKSTQGGKLGSPIPGTLAKSSVGKGKSLRAL